MMNDLSGGSDTPKSAAEPSPLNITADGRPPSYDDVTGDDVESASEGVMEGGDGNADAPPPYSALFPNKLRPNNIGRQVRRGISFGGGDDDDESGSGTGSFVKCCTFLCGCFVMLGLTVGIPVAMITIGAINLDDCKIESQIPIWLIVMGVFQLLEGGFRLCYHGSRDDSDDNEGMKDPVLCFLLVWFIVGNVWVFKNWDDYTPIKMNGTADTINDDYCDQLTMRFSYWTIISYYIVCGLLCLCGCLGLCYKVGSSDSDD